jgi:polyphosphate glucokinase
MAGKSARRPSSGIDSAIRRILAIDIGGTGLKAALIAPTGKLLTDHLRVKTPHHPTPEKLVAALVELVKPFKDYDRISIGFPGFVRHGVVFTAPNLGTKDWAGFKFAQVLEKKLKRQTRLVNDADAQGLAAIKGKGFELVCTLGTGFGTAWFRDGELMPHMDLAHMAARHKDDFDLYLGDGTLKKIGRKAWNKRVKKIVAMLEQVFFYDHLYLGGGNARLIKFKLPGNVSIVSNDAGLEGGAFLWSPRSK